MTPPPWIEDLSLLPEWLDPVSHEALRDPTEHSPKALVAAGRLLRGGHLPGGARHHLEEGLRSLELASHEAELRTEVEALAAAVEKALEDLPTDQADEALWTLLARRDDLESLSWALGLTGLESLERELLARCRQLDGRAGARRDQLAAALRDCQDPPAWLEAIAHHSRGAWWSNLLVASGHREQIEQWLTRPLVGSALASLGLSPRALERVAALQFGGESGSEPEAILSRPLGAPIASLFDGAVLVHTHGLAEHDDEVAPGLVVRHAEGEFESILEVKLEPEGPGLPHRSPLALAWWVPLAGASPDARFLQISLADPEADTPREERLAIAPLEEGEEDER